MTDQEHGKTKGFDLADAIRPVEVDLPGIGPVALQLTTTEFLRWFNSGEEDKRWNDGPSFVLALLLERAVPAGDAEGSTALRSSDLCADQVEAAAGIILSNAGAAFLPGRTRSEGKTPREGVAGSANPLAAEPGETGAMQLYRLARGYSEHHRRQSQRFLEELKNANSATDWLRKSNSLSSILKNQGMLASGSLSERVLRQRDALPSILKAQSAISAGLVGSETFRQALVASGQAQSLLRVTDTLASSSLFEGHRQLSLQLASRTSSLNRFQSTVSGMVGVQAWKTARERSRLFSERTVWAEALNTQLRLGLPASLLTSLAAQLAGMSTGVMPPEIATMMRPGYETVASAALEGLAGPAAAAAVLAGYEDRSEAPIFEAVRQTIIQLDAAEGSSEAFMSAFEIAWAAVLHAVAATPDLIRKPAFVALLALLISVAGVSLTAYQVFGPPPPEIISRMDQTNTELRAVNKAVTASGRQAEAARHIRFVETVVNLRTDPAQHAQVVRYVYPDQWVRLIETRGAWARVEVFDYGTDTTVTGWMSRRFLRNGFH